MLLVDFCIPVYNEEQLLQKNILKLLRFCQERSYAFNWRITIIVNGSTDRSLFLARSLAEQESERIKYVNIKEAGKGRAIREHMKQSRADVSFYMDVDLAVSLDNIQDVLEPVLEGECDLVAGSRLLPASQTKRSWRRGVSSRFYNFLANKLLKDGIKDHQCGFKAVKNSVFQSLCGFIQDDHWFFDTELIAMFAFRGYKIKEIPVHWEENRYDTRKSKVNLFRDSIKFIFKLLGLKIKLNKNKNRYRHQGPCVD
jgi:glycosyltransferase involved in cell wall biosynthesis